MNKTEKKIKDFLISKDKKFNSIFEIDKLPGGSSNETWIIKYNNSSKEKKIVLRRHFQGIRNIDNRVINLPKNQLQEEIKTPRPRRIVAILEAIRGNWPSEDIA